MVKDGAQIVQHDAFPEVRDMKNQKQTIRLTHSMKKTTDSPLTKLADAAFKKAAQKVVERAESTGTPVIVWQNNRIRKLKPGVKRAKPGTR